MELAERATSTPKSLFASDDVKIATVDVLKLFRLDHESFIFPPIYKGLSSEINDMGNAASPVSLR
jgi:hypothetical protein